jgi:hypothetical protein
MISDPTLAYASPTTVRDEVKVQPKAHARERVTAVSESGVSFAMLDDSAPEYTHYVVEKLTRYSWHEYVPNMIVTSSCIWKQISWWLGYSNDLHESSDEWALSLD